MPTHDIIETYNVKKKLLFTTAGWGIIFKNGFLKSSVVKMDVKVPYVTIEECIDKYVFYNILEKLFCNSSINHGYCSFFKDIFRKNIIRVHPVIFVLEETVKTHAEEILEAL